MEARLYPGFETPTLKTITLGKAVKYCFNYKDNTWTALNHFRSRTEVVFKHKTKITTSLCFCTVLGRSEWQSGRATYYYFFSFSFIYYFYCSPVSILLLKIPKVSEYLSINRKQLNVAIFAAGSRRVRSVYIGAGHS